MQCRFRLSPVQAAICLAFPMLSSGVVAAEPFPSLPPSLSTSVTPNVLLHLDNSGSMADAPSTGGTKTKMRIAKDVSKKLLDDNPGLRWGLFSFDPASTDRGRIAGILQSSVGTSISTIKTKIDGLTAVTGTPLGEALFEITRYYEGNSSYFNKIAGNYTSPVQYRCQKNFVIMVTDGVSTRDDDNKTAGPFLPGFTNRTGGVDYTTFNSDGNQVTRNFKVCKSTSTVSDISCPAKLEGSSVNNAFLGTSDDVNSYGRAVRDVAAYAFDMDVKTSGTDGDGKSYNDPKFAKQNIITYVVGFDVDDPVLLATSIVGGGKYFTATSESQLSASLNNAVSSIADMTSNAGGVSTKGDSISSGNKVFQPVFNPDGWFGELRCYDMSTTGVNGLGAACTPNAKAVFPAWSSRNIISSKVVTTTTTSFLFNQAALSSMTAAQQAALGSSANSNEERKNVIDFLRGSETITGYRRRPNGLLGDIIGGQPLSVTAPTGNTPDTAYAAFKTANATRGLVFVGANDGMLHGFRMSDMTEFVGYIPSAVYPRLKALKETNYGQSAGTPHVYHVNGPMRQADIKIGSNWMTLLAGGLAQGGQGYFGLNVTDETTAKATSAVKWEWTDVSDADMGYSFGAPVIYNVRTSATSAEPAVILVNGYENDFDDVASGGRKATAKSSALYILKAGTGELMKKIVLPTGSQGLSAPAGVDYGQDGVLDYIYAGDINGNLWRFDLTSDTPAGFKAVTTPIFVAKNAAGTAQPITIRPAILGVSRGTTSVGNLVMFGTGKLLQDADRTDVSVQSFYAILDEMATSPTTVTRSQLVERTILDTEEENRSGYRAGTYRQISTSPTLNLAATTNTKKGWFLDLPEETERLVTSPLLLVDKLLFGTGVPQAAEKCVPGGRGWVMGLNPLTGSVTSSLTGREYSFVDVKLDGTSTNDDKLRFASGSAFVSGFSTDGIPTELTYVSQSTRLVVPTTTNSGLGNAGSVIALQDANSMAVHTGNAGSGVSTGNPISRPEQSGKGSLIHCVQGQPNCSKDELNPAASGVKIETTLWREIK